MATVRGVLDDVLLLAALLLLIPVTILAVGAPLALLVRLAMELAQRF